MNKERKKDKKNIYIYIFSPNFSYLKSIFKKENL